MDSYHGSDGQCELLTIPPFHCLVSVVSLDGILAETGPPRLNGTMMILTALLFAEAWCVSGRLRRAVVCGGTISTVAYQ